MPGAYDEALIIIAGTSPESGDGRANNGLIVADALVALDRPGDVVPWLRDYLSCLEPMPGAKQAITRNDWQSALGDMSRVSDWVAFFQRELQQVPWQVVIGDWIPRLAPGLAGATGCGFMRTATTIHYLAEEETELRKSELAQGLSYWAAHFLRLPGIPGSLTTGSFEPVEALSRIKWQHKKRPPGFVLIGEGLQGLSGFSPFVGVLNLVKIPAEPLELISQTTEAMARVFLAHIHERAKLIPFMYAMAVPSTLRYLIPHMEPAEAPILLRYGWQFAGAMYSIYGRANPVETWKQPGENQDQLIERAIASGNEHSIIYTAVCLREYAVNPQPVYLAAAWEAVERLASTPEEPESPDQ